jgi:hypothetical protein
MAITYTARYSDANDAIVRWMVIQCEDHQDAVRTAAAKMRSPYDALELSVGSEIVWSGSRDRVNVWAATALRGTLAPHPK